MPLYEFTCPKCRETIEALMAINANAEAPLCISCQIPMEKGCGSIATYRIKGDIQGETPESRKYARYITNKKRR